MGSYVLVAALAAFCFAAAAFLYAAVRRNKVTPVPPVVADAQAHVWARLYDKPRRIATPSQRALYRALDPQAAYLRWHREGEPLVGNALSERIERGRRAAQGKAVKP